MTKRLLALAIACTMSASTPASSPAAPALRCALEAPAHALLLDVLLTHAGDLHLLESRGRGTQ